MVYSEIEKYISRLLEGSTPDKPLWNIENIRMGKKPSWNYIDGCMMTSLLVLGELTGEAKYFDFVKNFIDYYVRDDGSITGYEKEKYALDDICEGRVLFDLFDRTGEEKYRRATEMLFDQLKDQPRTVTGNFWHKAIYPDQIWLDGLYMAMVFYTRYQKAFGNKDYSDIAMQFENVHRLMRDEKTGLYYHGLDCSKKAFWADERGLSRNFWLRAMGWYYAALTDVCYYTESEELRAKLSGILRESLGAVSAYIDKESGMLYQVVDKIGKEGNYPETSGSCMVAYAMMKGARMGYCEKEYSQTGRNIFDSVCRKYLKAHDGELELDGICLVAGLGPENNHRRDGSYEYYISEPMVKNEAKGVAPFLMCYTEVKRQ